MSVAATIYLLMGISSLIAVLLWVAIGRLTSVPVDEDTPNEMSNEFMAESLLQMQTQINTLAYAVQSRDAREGEPSRAERISEQTKTSEESDFPSELSADINPAREDSTGRPAMPSRRSFWNRSVSKKSGTSSPASGDLFNDDDDDLDIPSFLRNRKKK